MEEYKFLVVSYMESGDSYYTKYSSSDGRSSKFHQAGLYDEDEVINYIIGLELDEFINNNYIRMDFFWHDHYIHTIDSFSPDNYNSELPESWQEKIQKRVNEVLSNMLKEKEAARLEKVRQAAIMKEQQEEREYKRLSKKYGAISEVGVSFTKFSQ